MRRAAILPTAVFFLTAFLPAALLLFGCTQEEAALKISFNISEEHAQYITELLERHPLPEEIEQIKDTNEADWVITVSTRSWDDHPRQNNERNDHHTYSRNRTVAFSWFAPVVPFSDSAVGASLSDVAEGTFEVKPLQEIELPYRALPVDGRYPYQDGYPLTAEYVVRMYAPLEPVFHEGLQEWFASIPVEGGSPEPAVWIAGVGDLMPGRGVDRILLTRSDGIEYIFGNTLSYLRSSDLVLGNLETAVTERGEPVPKSYNFRIAPEVLGPLKAAGFDYFSLTNNHCFDYGKHGFLDTLDALNHHGIATSGAGTTLAEAAKPFRTTIGGETVQILSFGAYPQELNGFNGEKQAGAGGSTAGILWEGEAAFTSMQHNFGDDTFDIIMIHGGKEWSTEPTDHQIELYRRCIDYGADIVLGSHPHVLQGIEVYRGKLIAYSLGNFIFPGMEETAYGEESLILRAGIVNGRILYLEYIPVRILGTRLTVDEKNEILKRFLSRTDSLIFP